jgi:hypothetical protein
MYHDTVHTNLLCLCMLTYIILTCHVAALPYNRIFLAEHKSSKFGVAKVYD